MELLVSAKDLANLHAAVLARAPEEGGAFLAVEPSCGRLVGHSFRVFSDDDLERDSLGLILKENRKVALLADVKRSGHGVVDVHSHPFSDGRVGFSDFDLSELPQYARYVTNKLSGRPFGSLVLGRRSYEGLFWRAGIPESLTLRGVGERASMPRWLPDHGATRLRTRERAIYDRQIRALGIKGQARLAKLKVAVVGLGGTGSQVVEHLAHIGVRSFVLVDDDVVESSNLSRLAGATRADARAHRAKDAVAKRLVRQVQPTASVSCPGTLRRTPSLELLATSDLIIGCVDNDGARLILSELASAHLVPYIDLGVSIERLRQGGIGVGGRVAFQLPSGPCLACADELDFTEAAEDLESEALRRIRVDRGYATDRRVEAALMPLNTVVVGLAMTEFLAFATGIRPVIPFQRYDFEKQRIVRARVDRNEECPLCAPSAGMGDRQQITRYALEDDRQGDGATQQARQQ